MNNDELILSEVRDLSTRMNDFQIDVSSRLSVLETQNKQILGDTLPGRLQLAEESITELNRGKYWMLGIASSIAFFAGISSKWLSLLVSKLF